MHTYRNYTIETMEQDRIAYRHVPKHKGQTYAEFKAARKLKRQKLAEKIMLLIWGVSIAVSLYWWANGY